MSTGVDVQQKNVAVLGIVTHVIVSTSCERDG